MYTIQKHLQYHAWANGKIAEIIKSVDENLLDKEITSSFPSIRKTLYHIWDAEVIWFRRLQGGEATTWPSHTFTGNTSDALNLFVSHSSEIARFFADKDPVFLKKIIVYKNTKGIEFATPVEEILFHMVNHATYHRGQLVTMLRQVGVTQFPPMDLIAYIRQFSTTSAS